MGFDDNIKRGSWDKIRNWCHSHHTNCDRLRDVEFHGQVRPHFLRYRSFMDVCKYTCLLDVRVSLSENTMANSGHRTGDQSWAPARTDCGNTDAGGAAHDRVCDRARQNTTQCAFVEVFSTSTLEPMQRGRTSDRSIDAEKRAHRKIETNEDFPAEAELRGKLRAGRSRLGTPASVFVQLHKKTSCTRSPDLCVRSIALSNFGRCRRLS